MIQYNSTILKHEADHYDELVKRFADLSIEIDGSGCYYFSDQIAPLINKFVFNIDMHSISEEKHTAAPILVQGSCSLCTHIYKDEEWVINSKMLPIDVCFVSHQTTGGLISCFAYDDAINELKMPPSLINDIDLYVINLIKENKYKHLRVNNRIHNLLSFI